MRTQTKKKFSNLITKILRHCPGGELRTCPNIGPQASDCVRHRDHLGRCEDAWGFKWNKKDSL